MQNLPLNRHHKKLGDIAKTQSGGTPSRTNPSFWGGEIVWLKSGELNDNLCITEYTETITQAGVDGSSAKVFPQGTLLMAMYGATAGKLGILGIDATTNQAVCSIQNTQGLFDPKFIYYFLFKEREKIISDSFGGAQPNISKSYIDNIQIPLPPLATQHAITRLLDDASASIHTTTDALRSQITQLDALRASTLDEMFGNKEWEKVKLGEISHKIQYGYTGKTIENGTYKYLRITDIQNNTVNRETVPFVDVENHEAKKYLLNTGDVIFARTGATVGKSFLIDEVGENKIFASYLIRVVPQYNYIIPEFLKYFFQSGLYRSQIYADVVGAAQPNFNGKKLGEITIPLPDLATQTAIVSRLDHLSQSISLLRSSYTTQLTHHDELRASILDQTFSGQLIQG